MRQYGAERGKHAEDGGPEIPAIGCPGIDTYMGRDKWPDLRHNTGSGTPSGIMGHVCGNSTLRDVLHEVQQA
jgi:hypothetical protein